MTAASIGAIDLHLLDQFSYFDEPVVMIAGSDAVVLKRAYDPDQLWFDFGHAFVFLRERFSAEDTGNTIENLERSRAYQASIDREILYTAVRGVDQLPLVFPCRRALTRREMSQFRQAEYAGWDLNEDGEHFMFKIDRKVHSDDVLDWLDDNAIGLYHARKATIILQNERDAALFRLKFPTL